MMTCGSSALVAVNVAEQTLAAGAFVPFATNAVYKGAAIVHVAGSTTVSIAVPGTYLVSVNADISPTATGETTAALYNNGVAVPGAEATFSGTTADYTHVAFTTLVRVRRSCCAVDNSAALQVGLAQGADIQNASITVLGVA